MGQSKNQTRAMEFALSHVALSRKYKAQFIDKWQELLANWMVEPDGYASSVQDPYLRGRHERGEIYGSRGIILKDPETHKAIMTYASRLVLTALGDPRGEYVQAMPVGWEDAPGKAPTATRLIRYCFGLPGHLRTMIEAVFDLLIFGTSVVEVSWMYREREQLVREFTDTGGVLEDSFTRQPVIQYDDVRLSVVDNQDFFPDPSQPRIEDMNGVAKKFRSNKMKAEEMVEMGLWDAEGVRMAIDQIGKDRFGQSSREARHSESEDIFREGIDQPEYRDELSSFTPMVGFEYWGNVPWKDMGSSRRVITVLNGFTVRDDEYPLADADLPFRALVINPVTGRFYGKSPAEVIRWDQSLQDAIKILLAEALIRAVHPPMIYDTNSDIDLNKLMRFSPDIPIGTTGGINNIGTLRYDANVFAGFQQTRELKQSMQEAVAPGIAQGLGMPNSRSSATEASISSENAMSKFELGSMLIEREGLPMIATSMLRRCQQFLDQEGLEHRVGQQPQPYWIGDIMGDFDIRFVGSRLAMSRQEKLQSYDRLVALSGAVPEFRMMVPWMQIGQRLIGEELELPEVAGMIGSPEVMQQNMLLSQIAGGPGGAGANGVPQRPSPVGQLPAQASGNIGA